MSCPIVENMVQIQKLRLILSATTADISAVSHDRFVSEFGPVFPASLALIVPPSRRGFEPDKLGLMIGLQVVLILGPPSGVIFLNTGMAQLALTLGVFSGLTAFRTLIDH